MSQPFVSIITPTYNHEKYIAECIESVLLQNYENWEMIIIDDNSADCTYDIAVEYAKRDKRIKVVRHKENYGPLNLDKTYNEALEMAKGNWIAILEGDDVWPYYKLKRQVDTLNNLPEDVILLHGEAGYIYEDIKKVIVPRKKFSFSIDSFNTPYDPFEHLIYGLNPVYSQTVLIKKESLIKIRGFIQKPKEILLVDFPTWLRLSRIGRFYFDEVVLGFWRRHEYSITMNNQDKIAISYVKSIEEFLKEEGLEDFINNECVGKLQFFGALGLTILKRDYSSANMFLKELESCINSNKISISNASKLKLYIYKLVIALNQPWMLNILYKIKRNRIDKVICEYKPFFFREFLKENKLLCAE